MSLPTLMHALCLTGFLWLGVGGLITQITTTLHVHLSYFGICSSSVLICSLQDRKNCHQCWNIIPRNR